MSDIIASAPGNGPWRLLVLDPDGADPHWVIATVALSSDVRPATLDPAGAYTDWEETTRWVRSVLGRPEVALSPLAGVLAWSVDETGSPR